MGQHMTVFVGALIAAGSAVVAKDAGAVELYKSDTMSVEVYGQINKGILWADDGFQNKTYGIVDNDNSSSRIGLRTKNELSFGWVLKGRAEIQWEPKSTGNINALDPNSDSYEFRDYTALRHLDISMSNKSYGTFSLGQGSMASDGAGNIDQSKTKVVALTPKLVAGGLQFYDWAVPGYGAKIKGDFDNLDGVRLMRIRYDTPSFNGLTFSAAYGYKEFLAPGVTDDRRTADVALRYKKKLGDFKLLGALFYEERNSRAGRTEDRSRIGLNATALHEPTGLNVKLLVGQEDIENRSQKGDVLHAKFGIVRDFFSVGYTALAVDYYRSEGLADETAKGTSWGFSAVQKIDNSNLELYASYRNYDFQEAGSDYSNIDVVLTGLRWKF